MNSQGTTSNKTLDNFKTFKDNEIYDIGGCVTFQTQGEISKLTSVENFLNSVNNYRAKLSSYILNDMEMIIFVSDFSAYKVINPIRIISIPQLLEPTN